MIAVLRRFLQRALYRVWQFKQVLFPELQRSDWENAISGLSEQVRSELGKLRKSEKAHIMRVWSDISHDGSLSETDRVELLELALVHDIGKAVTRPTLFFKVAKVLLPLANTEHCVAGAKLLKRLKQNRQLIRRVLRHHDEGSSDRILRLFQAYDDRN
ncbi:MAG TPA: HD domain-containing protein [Candidatus Rifleibacterium sp.]|nr:HD domain-containing protein [Candidatus Rifleibacterium sp.]